MFRRVHEIIPEPRLLPQSNGFVNIITSFIHPVKYRATTGSYPSSLPLISCYTIDFASVFFGTHNRALSLEPGIRATQVQPVHVVYLSGMTINAIHYPVDFLPIYCLEGTTLSELQTSSGFTRNAVFSCTMYPLLPTGT